MQYLRILITALSLGSVALPAFAEPSCLPTARIRTSHYPGASSIPTNNNLVLPTGKSIEPEGQKLVLTGQLLESTAVPELRVQAAEIAKNLIQA